MRKRAGFTLIELLVVIAIIGILAAILFPVMSRVKQSGYKVSCVSNLMNIGKALKLYARDYSGSYPRMDERTSPSREFPGCGRSDLNSWADILWRSKYVAGGRKVFVCPIAKTPSPNVGAWSDPAVWDASPLGLRNNYARAAQWGFVPYQYSYGANYWVIGAGTSPLVVSESWNISVARIIWVTEANWNWFSNQYETNDGKWIQQSWEWSYIDWRHPSPSSPGLLGTRDGAANFLMLDGHVVWLRKYVKEPTPTDKQGYYIAPPGGRFEGWFGAEE